MIITPITTKPITVLDKNLATILDEYIVSFSEKSILAVTSKIVSIIEGSVVKKTDITLQSLVQKEANAYLAPHSQKFDVALTVKNNTLIANAGIDQSNANDYLVMWPKNPQESANHVREYLKKRFNLNQCGVIITDSVTTPLHWGTTGISIAHSGFWALNDYRGTPDIFGKKLEITQSNIANGLAAAAVLTMGEGAEQTPLAVLSDIPTVTFQDHNPNQKELDELIIDPKDDLYSPLLTTVMWQKGKK